MVVLRVSSSELLLSVVIALVISISVGLALFGLLGVAPDVGWSLIASALGIIIIVTVGATLIFHVKFKSYASERAVRVAMMTLSEEERAILGKIMELGNEIRQDDLWRKLREDFSKSRLSALLINLEKKNAITRTRYGRTNILKLTSEFKKH